jgi:hypothetical protein
MNIGGVEQHLEHQWEATFLLTLTDRGAEFTGGDPPSDPVVETHAFPEPLRNGRIDAEMAKRDIRRRSATIMLEDITSGALLGNPEVRGLLDAWQDPYDPRSFNEIELALIDLGRPAVPYLLAALADERAVRPDGHYPGLDELNREELRVYHLADRVLSEILQRERGLDLLSTEDLRLRVITGWTWAWEDAQGVPEEFRVDPEARRTSMPGSP